MRAADNPRIDAPGPSHGPSQGDGEQARWRDLARAAGGWLFETDATLRFRWVSGAFVPYTTAEPAQIIGQRVLDVPLLDAEGQPRPDGLRLRARLADPTPLVETLSAWAVGGESRIVAINALPFFGAEEKFGGWRGSARDVTDLLFAQARARERRQLSFEDRLVEAAADSGIGFAELDVASGRMAFDAVACANHGLPFPHPPYQVAEWLAAVHPDDQPGAQAALEEALARTGRMAARYRFLKPGGEQTWLEVTASVRRAEDGGPGLVTGTCRDVTAQVRNEELLREKEAAERASRAKSEVVSRVSHELRTPLNAILGLAQLMALDDASLTASQRTRVAGIGAAGRHLLHLVNDMLDLARLEQGPRAPMSERVDVLEQVRQAMAMVQPLAAARQVRLEPPAPALGPGWAWADERALQQLLINLLSNAIKYNREAGRVWVEWRPARGGDGAHRLAVCDEGPGLTAAQQAQLFQPFNRLGAERRGVEGSGLGLVIARKLAETMQGGLDVESREGEGCRFWLSLPAATLNG